MGHNSEKLLGFGALFFRLLAVEMLVYSTRSQLVGDHDRRAEARRPGNRVRGEVSTRLARALHQNHDYVTSCQGWGRGRDTTRPDRKPLELSEALLVALPVLRVLQSRPEFVGPLLSDL